MVPGVLLESCVNVVLRPSPSGLIPSVFDSMTSCVSFTLSSPNFSPLASPSTAADGQPQASFR
jgi:hypothetical protein